MNRGRTTGRAARGLRHVLAVALSLACVAAAADDRQGRYMVLGGIDCARYHDLYRLNLEQRSAPDMVTGLFAQSHAWIKGYLTAYNCWVDNGLVDILQEMDAEQVERWIADYCVRHPAHDLPDALKAFVEERLDAARPTPAGC